MFAFFSRHIVVIPQVLPFFSRYLEEASKKMYYLYQKVVISSVNLARPLIWKFCNS